MPKFKCPKCGFQSNKLIILQATITKAADYNTAAIFNDLPVKSRNQIIEILLEDDFWQILYLKNNKVKIIIDKEQLPD